MNIQNRDGSYYANLMIDGSIISIPPNSNYAYYTINSPTNTPSSNNNKGLLESIKRNLFNEIKQKSAEFRQLEGLAPSDVESKTKEEIANLYKQIGKIESLISSF